ncbi:MAG: hypothetical protein IAB16_01910, partial [Firmicutes bacterium]|nr:hypothetical protein [Candidatus Stercoripulliclostridium pullicola]
ALLIVFFIEIVVFTEGSAPEVSDTFFAVYGVTMFLTSVAGITAFALSIKFRRAFNGIISRAPASDELPAVNEYRAKTFAAAKARNGSRKAGVAVIISGVVLMILLIVIDTIQAPESEDFGPACVAGIIVGIIFTVAGIFILTFSKQRISSGDGAAANGRNVEEIIDDAQGRKQGYSLQTDANLQSLKYLFPNPELRGKAEELRRKQSKHTTVALIVSTFAGLLTALLFFSSLVLSVGAPHGYGVPFFVTLVFVAVFCTVLPSAVQLDRLEKLQKKELDENPEYALNRKIYAEYEAHSKIKGKVLPIAYCLSIIAGFAIAAALPDRLWSLCSVIPLMAGLYLNSFFVTQLRKKVIPIEREIDEKEAAAACVHVPADYSVSVESPAEEYVIAEKDDDDERY